MKHLPRLADGLLLCGLGIAMIVVAATGDSLLYVRDVMTVPLILAGAVVAVLGISMLVSSDADPHTPRSFAFVGVAIAFFLVIRPGPLSVSAGIAFDPDTRTRVQQEFEIPRESLVGADASTADIEASAFELHAGQLYFAAQQLPAVFDEMAIRMIGQFELSDDGDTRLVRFRINCCAADALPLVTPLDGDLTGVATGDWVEVFGQWDGDADEPGLDVVSIRSIDTPDHPYLTIRDP
ncbi:MAG: hypothetical protein KDB40_01780 [Acidimicrobiales bacterium]|nr:hypothetical protein [Acidimicrobiales bacterium]MCB9393412.1 hypothetical protein [Acidimicrobiaceae bacterium]